jgi:B12-binding domain/radical SAM domain protein
MPETDIVLVHAPTVYDFRKRPAAFGPVSDVVPSTSVFEMYPLGFLTMANYLARKGYRARLANVALRMLRSRRFDPERYLSRMHPRMFGIDLHWAVHAHGALEVAKILKRLHPDTPIVFGGLSSTYFHDELIRLPFVDFVLCGDSVERPLARLVAAVRAGAGFEDVPNLVWKRAGEPVANGITDVPLDLDHCPLDYGEVIRSAIRHMDPVGHLPYSAWPAEGTTALIPFRGCVHDCAICGGGRSAYERFFGRKRIGVRSPERLAEDCGRIASLLRGPIVIIGDPRMPGADYAARFLDAVEPRRITNSVMLEFFSPPDRDFLERARRAFPRLNVQISPESDDVSVRKCFGRGYDNTPMGEFLESASELCDRVDLFYMIGLPEQTRAAVDETVARCEELIEERSRGGNVHPHIAPLAPFLDPGSRVFEDPEAHGYRVFRRTLADHAEALLTPRWQDALTYETKWLSREDIASATYDSTLRLTRAKARHGLIPAEALSMIERNIAAAVEGKSPPVPGLDGETVAKAELRWPKGLVPVRPLAALKALLGS